MRSSRKATITLAIVLLLGCMIQATSLMVPKDKNVSKVTIAVDSPQPVLIQSDNDFITQGWPGNGSLANPYVIQGLHFQSSQRPYVNISNVESYFVIRDCSFLVNTTESYGVFVSLLKVKQFLIANSTFNQAFIYVRNSTTCAFKGNNLTSDNVPIEAWFCNHIELTDNHIVFSNQPIMIWNCGNLTARGNELVGDGFFIADVRDAFEFVSNAVLGDLYFTLNAASMNISANTFAKALMTSISDRIDVSSRTMVISHNNFTTGGILFSRDFSPYVRGLFNLSGNYMGGRLIPFLKGLHSQAIDCYSYPEVIAYDCADIILSRVVFSEAATAIAVLGCKNVTVANAYPGGCSTGIFLEDCNGCTVMDSETLQCGTGIVVTNCSISRILRCYLQDRDTGIFLRNADNATIVFNTMDGNDYGVMIEFCSGLLVYGNTFVENRQSVFYHFYASPFDKWDNGDGEGNAWSDYFGFGPYIVSIMPGWTLADHYPRSTLAQDATPVAFVRTVVLMVSALIVCVACACRATGRGKGALAKAMTSRNNGLLMVSLVWLLVPPFVLMIEFSDYIGTTVVLSSMSYAIWYDLGSFYASPTFFTLSAYNLYSVTFQMQILCIILLFALVGIAWNDKRRGHHRRLASNPILWTAVVYCIFALILRGTPYGGWFSPQGIPIPISPVLLLLTLRHVVPEAPNPLKDEFRQTMGEAARCPYCGASYVYPKDRVAADGMVECQNCAKRFKPDGGPESQGP